MALSADITPSPGAETFHSPMSVTAVRYYPSFPDMFTYPLCPRCRLPMEYEYQAFCNHCGQALDWKHFSKALVVLA